MIGDNYCINGFLEAELAGDRPCVASETGNRWRSFLNVLLTAVKQNGVLLSSALLSHPADDHTTTVHPSDLRSDVSRSVT